MKTLVLFYSTYGHAYKLAEAIAAGGRKVEGNEAALKQVPETLPSEREGARFQGRHTAEIAQKLAAK